MRLNRVTTHGAIKYSQKAQTHKYVHLYLHYGILFGDREYSPVPGRLFRHGQHFDFMLSWKSLRADNNEMKRLIKIIIEEIKASKTLDEILFNSRSKERDKFTTLHRPLKFYNE